MPTINASPLRILFAALVTALFLVTGSTAYAAEKSKPVVKLATSAWIGYAPFYVAVEKNLFDKYGVKVELQDFADPALMPSALQSGSIHGAMYTYDQVIMLVANGHDFRVVMPIDYSNGADALVASKKIKSIAELKGRRVAYPFSTCDNLLVNYALKSAGLTEADIKGVDTTPENVPAALASGVDAGATYEPNVTKALKLKTGAGFHTLYTSASAPGLITDVLYFPAKFIKQNKEQVTAIIRGYLDGLDYMNKHPQEAQAIIAKQLAATAQEVAEQAKGVRNIPLADMTAYYEPRQDAQSLYTSGAMIAEIQLKRKQIPKAPSIEDTFDASFVAAIVAKP
ncbi:ABC transporter substrate-binding protein [Methylobacillus sp.]|uniref:ABC transporter substrate-binding protein n=1 Tax=Methylobacillus sp. TaxID=56818 RepID=UPI00257D5808|nr:ABC transporter substrate-binding protein [Methylobacillus sp.]